MGGLGGVYGPRSMRRFCRRKKFQSSGSFNFQIDTVCQPGETLLWDLIQDDKIVISYNGYFTLKVYNS